jgi:hypothetical protein
LGGGRVGDLLYLLAGEVDRLSGQRGEVVEQVGEATDGQVVGGVLGLIFGFRLRGAGGRRNRVYALGNVFVGEGEWGEGCAQMPDEVGGEHADEHVGADPIGQVVEDGPQVQVVYFDAGEVCFHVFEVFVGGDDLGGVHCFTGHAGAEDVYPVEVGLGPDFVGVAPVGELIVGDVEDDVFPGFVLVDDLADGDADGVAPGEVIRLFALGRILCSVDHVG